VSAPIADQDWLSLPCKSNGSGGLSCLLLLPAKHSLATLAGERMGEECVVNAGRLASGLDRFKISIDR